MNFKKEKIFFVVIVSFFCYFSFINFVEAGRIRATCDCVDDGETLCSGSVQALSVGDLSSACETWCASCFPEGEGEAIIDNGTMECIEGREALEGREADDVCSVSAFEAGPGAGVENAETEKSTVKAIQLESPIEDTDIVPLIGRVIRTALGVVGAIALLMFVYGGLIWLTSGGTPDKIKKGMDVLLWAAIGLVVIFASYTLVDFVFTAFGI